MAGYLVRYVNSDNLLHNYNSTNFLNVNYLMLNFFLNVSTSSYGLYIYGTIDLRMLTG